MLPGLLFAHFGAPGISQNVISNQQQKQPQPPGMAWRWAAFFLIFVGVNIFFVWKAAQRQAELEAKQAEAVEVADVPDPADAPPDVKVDPTPVDEPEELLPEDDPADTDSREPADIPEAVSLADAPSTTVRTSLVQVTFTHLGAVPLSWEILPSEYVAPVEDQYSVDGGSVELIPQVEDRDGRSLPLQLTGRTLADFNRVVYDIERETLEGKDVLTFLSPAIDGVQVVKTFSFDPESYVVDYTVTIRNGDVRTRLGDGRRGWGTGWQGGFLQPMPQDRMSGRIKAAASVDGELRTKILDEEDDPVSYENELAWAGQLKKYFTALLIPDPSTPAETVELYVRKRDISDEYRIKGVPAPMSVELLHPMQELQPRETATLSYHLLVGPKDYTLMKSLNVPMLAGGLAPNQVVFDEIFYGKSWIRPISIFLLAILRWCEGHVHNWGWSIILLVLMVKTVLYPLSHWAIKNQAKSMAEMKRIRPELEKLNEKYKSDPQKRGQEMIKLYREHNISMLGPMRGCFPMLLQMPIFIALYVLLGQSVELRGQPFLWIENLAAPDRLFMLPFTVPLVNWSSFNLLPLLMVVTQYFTSKLMMSQVADPQQRQMQQQMMIMMPLFFLLFLYNMPAGLMLYWTVQNVWQIGHTVLTKRYVELHDRDNAQGKGSVSPSTA